MRETPGALIVAEEAARPSFAAGSQEVERPRDAVLAPAATMIAGYGDPDARRPVTVAALRSDLVIDDADGSVPGNLDRRQRGLALDREPVGFQWRPPSVDRATAIRDEAFVSPGCSQLT